MFPLVFVSRQFKKGTWEVNEIKRSTKCIYNLFIQDEVQVEDK